MRIFVLSFFLIICIVNTKAQNNLFRFYKSDTLGGSFKLTFNIDQADFNDVKKIAFYKYVSGTTDPILIKEISVNKVGNYFLVKDGTQSNMIQNSFITNFSVLKSEYSGISKFSYKLFKISSVSQELDANKPN